MRGKGKMGSEEAQREVTRRSRDGIDKRTRGRRSRKERKTSGEREEGDR